MKTYQIKDIGFLYAPHLDISTRVQSAHRIMLSYGLNTLSVTRGTKLVGIISLNDILNSVENNELTIERFIKLEVLVERVGLNTSIIDVIDKFVSKTDTGTYFHYKSSLPIIDDDDNYIGTVTYIDVLKKIKPILSDYKINEIEISTDFATVLFPNNKLTTAFSELLLTGQRQFLVVNETKRGIEVKGILKDEQILQYYFINDDKKEAKTEIKNIMINAHILKTITSKNNLGLLIDIFSNKELGLKIYPVKDRGVLTDIISYIDLLKKAQEILQE